MGEQTGIQWTDHTFNPWIGCTEVDAGCANCYARELMAGRWRKVEWGVGAERRVTSDAYWKQPYRWNAAALAEGRRRRVFCASLADVFDRTVPGDWRAWLLDLIQDTPALDWQILTKRPQLIPTLAPVLPANVWIGASVCDRRGLYRIQQLRQVRAPADWPWGSRPGPALRFLSLEPLLEDLGLLDLEGVGWVIVGGESGKGARPCELAWIRSVVSQCRAASVPVFVKQMGSRPVGSITAGDLGESRARAVATVGGAPFNLDAQTLHLRHSHGGDPAEWPEDLRIREFPAAAA
jgi:protein gp37